MPRVVVVKLGTALVTGRDGEADADVLASTAKQIRQLVDEKRRIAVVSSGAVGAGVKVLGLGRRPKDLPRLQAAAAAGQPVLAAAWAKALSDVGLRSGQVLLTREDVDQRHRFLNVRNTVAALWHCGAIPIINENDAVSTAELPGGEVGGAETFGDNDRLAAAVSAALSAEMLVLLSTVDGLLDEEGQVVREVTELAAAEKLCRRDTSVGGTGGMKTKLLAARLVTEAGETMILANGRTPDALVRATTDDHLGTRFIPADEAKLQAKLRWVQHAATHGTLTLDAGAATALRRRRASLLPAGVTQVTGTFARGEVVRLIDDHGTEVARGVAAHDSETCRTFAGRRSSELQAEHGPDLQAELVHRDLLVIQRLPRD